MLSLPVVAALALVAGAAFSPPHAQRIARAAAMLETARASRTIAIPTDVSSARVDLLGKAFPAEAGTPNALHVQPAERRDGRTL